MTIKKAFTEIVALLQANEDAVVSDVLPSVIEMASAKTGSGGGKASTFHKDEDGNVVAIYCYYHKAWMDPRVEEFGTKSSSPTGLNNMCKDGVSKWTKQQRAAKNAEAELLNKVASGEIAPDGIADAQAEIAEAAKEIVPLESGYGFATLEEVLADSEARGL